LWLNLSIVVILVFNFTQGHFVLNVLKIEWPFDNEKEPERAHCILFGFGKHPNLRPTPFFCERYSIPKGIKENHIKRVSGI